MSLIWNPLHHLLESLDQVKILKPRQPTQPLDHSSILIILPVDTPTSKPRMDLLDDTTGVPLFRVPP